MRTVLATAVAVLVVLGMFLSNVSAQVGGTELDQNPPDHLGDDPIEPGGGSCPDPWPLKATVLGIPHVRVGIREIPQTGQRSVSNQFNVRFSAFVCPGDEVGIDASAAGDPGLEIVNMDASRTMTIRWTYLNGYYGEQSISPGAAYVVVFDGWQKVEVTSDPVSDVDPKGPGA